MLLREFIYHSSDAAVDASKAGESWEIELVKETTDVSISTDKRQVTKSFHSRESLENKPFELELATIFKVS